MHRYPIYIQSRPTYIKIRSYFIRWSKSMVTSEDVLFSRIHIQISHKILLDIFFSTYTRNTSHTFFYLIIITSIERYRENRNREHHGKRSDTRPDQVANRIILPSSFQGRAINKGQNFQDAMTACHLDLIVSFTCNNVEEMVPCSKTTGSN